MTNIPELSLLVSRWNDSQEEYILHSIENFKQIKCKKENRDSQLYSQQIHEIKIN